MTVLDTDVATGDDLTAYRPVNALPPVPPRRMRFHTTNVGPRIGWSLASALLVTLGDQAWASSFALTFAAYAGVVMILLGLFGVAACWMRENGPSTWVQALIMVGVATFVGIEEAQAVLSDTFYGTDAVAFGQYAAELAVKGLNPYAHSMYPSMVEYRVPYIYSTHFLDGSVMDKMSYPAGNFLAYMPFIALGWKTQTALVIDVAYWIIAGFLMWRLLPSAAKYVAPILMGIAIYWQFAVGGVNDTLYMPFLLLAVWRWDKFADPDERGMARWIGPVALGLAMSIKQTPWFAFPFLLIGITLEARARNGGFRWQTPARYVAIIGAIFLLINAPWLIANPTAWYNGSIAPLTAAFIPQGQGLVNLTLAAGHGGGNLSLFTIAGALWVLLALMAMVLRYGQVKRLWFILVIASFFFTPRSFGNYLICMLPAAMLAAVSVDQAPEADRLGVAGLGAGRLRRPAAITLIAVLAGSLAAAALAVIVPAPLKMTVMGLHTNGQKMSIVDVAIKISNHTDKTLTPHFTMASNGLPLNFWYPQGSTTGNTSVTLAPHATQTVTLHAPDNGSMPDVNAPFQVLAYTAGPNTVSTTAPYVPSATKVELTPMGFAHPFALGTPVTVNAQLTDRVGRPLHKAGVKISLGQVIYAEAGLLGGESSINGMQEGVSPGFSTTDANGQATFTITGKSARNDPTYYQAWLTGDAQTPPTGYSGIVSVQFYSK